MISVVFFLFAQSTAHDVSHLVTLSMKSVCLKFDFWSKTNVCDGQIMIKPQLFEMKF